MGVNVPTFFTTQDTEKHRGNQGSLPLCPSVLSVVKPSSRVVSPRVRRINPHRQPDPQLRNDALERANDSSDSACSGYLWSRLLFLRLDHIEILVSRSRVKEHDPIFGAEEAAGAQFLISNK